MGLKPTKNNDDAWAVSPAAAAAAAGDGGWGVRSTTRGMVVGRALPAPAAAAAAAAVAVGGWGEGMNGYDHDRQ